MLWAFVLWLASGMTAVQAGEVSRLSVGAWRISAQTDERGRLVSCTAGASYNTGLVLIFLINSDESWALGVSGAPVKRIRGRRGAAQVALKVDSLPPRVLEGQWFDQDLLIARLPDDDDMFNALRQGRKLYVVLAQANWAFDLTDTYPMLTALYRCATSGAAGLPPPQNAAPRAEPPAPAPAPSSEAPGAPAERPGTVSTGSGFFVRSDGVGLTNAHVVKGCREALITGYGQADIVARDVINDLALLRLRTAMRTTPATLRRRALQLGESVYALGFPLAGELDNGLNFTAGLVSSLAGAGNDTRNLQLTAPIQPGNSGGPILDRSALVVGVTQSKFNDLVALERNGSVPQNLNFGIKAALVASFLRSNGYEPEENDAGETLEPPAIAEIGRAFTFQIICAAQ